MPQFIAVPVARLTPDVLRGLLEEFASRDGTDYGERELSLGEKVERLQRQLTAGDLQILFETESEQWDLVPAVQAGAMLNE